ncbi:unnamed protein product [Rotaria magnacalcarata]|uniref:Uncharacterized protein n=1 Tax=Rotaria magnacalcarata TaxID=392030 RepID=A0A816LFE2_9BILA|nr:unnamed protein product [Rotaria magnacalcarata]
MRGIEAAQTYLLMPHIGQVIAIFRLLGLGYEKYEKIPVVNVVYNEKISDDLVNNLVQVGTQVKVNHFEVLSMRDKNDFAPGFRALGIEERIQYGSFNTLCEQLLNEQCNGREKVRDTIVTNQSALAVVDTSARIRPKVLLIDEMGVFLSDKLYDGVYTSSVYFKGPSIKTLLDTLW